MNGKGEVAGVEEGEIVVQRCVADGDVVIGLMLRDERKHGRHITKVRQGISESEVWVSVITRSIMHTTATHHLLPTV